ncbi:kielin/chordin-like protein [Homalodisca vitripennis]|uniref:kielin/chordin-like protein n=1 Tax=Homalodisca vitripennis TaxID=197043 RepID=UPI001EE9EAF5|nr:kielin/chordin-like protein [Homalodisca vitripennis]XP_046682502.1 kielin/chordin-like protein [Homalodisca vitripennis]
MWCVTFLLALSSSAFTLVNGECPTYEKDYYTDIGCVPEAVDDSGCPTSYDCNSLTQRSLDKCYYKGRAYEEGHKLDETPDAPCLVECRCEPTGNSSVAFSCVGVECPSEFEPPPEPGCYNVHEHGQCCSVKEICDSNSKEGEAEGKTPKEMCEYNNKVYQVGEQFYPEESSCLECICGPGFVGLLQEPFCRKINCSLELNYAERIMDGCVPVYFGNNDCCPHGWRCPDLSDSVMPSESGSETKEVSASEKSCKFGALTMRVGEKLNPVTDGGGEWHCSCRVPPHPICVETRSPQEDQ